jgi:hypothetical protein
MRYKNHPNGDSSLACQQAYNIPYVIRRCPTLKSLKPQMNADKPVSAITTKVTAIFAYLNHIHKRL